MQSSTFQFDFSDLKLNVAQIEKVMGYKDGESQETISELTQKAMEEAASLCRIKAEYRVFEVDKLINSEKSIEIDSLVFNVKKIVYAQIKKSESVAVFLCTAGEGPGIRSRKAMKEGDLLTGYIFDVIGSEIADAAADLMQASLRDTMASKGKHITNRYSPGYCGWDVAEQHKLFQLMPDNFCGIKLNASALMDPEKSVSGFIGIGEYVKYNQYTCGLCNMENCIYRKVRSNK